MKTHLSIVYFVLLCLIVSCNNDSKQKHPKKERSKNEKPKTVDSPTDSVEIDEAVKSNTSDFNYTYNQSTTKVKWTAFKHSTKAPVGGEFKSIAVEGFIESNKITEALKNISFSLFTSSTDTQDKERDMKIIANFFGNMINPSIITGKILEIKEDGNGKVLIGMNNAEKTISFKWEIDENNEFFLTANLNMLDWNTEVPFEILNTVCSEKHTGLDGEKKLWPNVEIIVFTTLKRQ